MTKRRPTVPTSSQTKLLFQSGRRCAMCFGLNGDIEVKEGQIAHLDHDTSNNNPDNLAWLCLFHHDQYDSIRRQAKGIKLQEVKIYRTQLYSQLSVLLSKNTGDKGKQFNQTRSDEILELLDRYSGANETTTNEIITEIINRIDLIHQFTLLDEEVAKLLKSQGIEDDGGDAHYAMLEMLVEQKLNFPNAMCVLQSASQLWPSWKMEIEEWAKEWIGGLMNDEAYEEMLQNFEEGYELDLLFIFYGHSSYHLLPPQVRALWRFTHEHGQRKYIKQLRSESERDEVPF
jgi:hypothetical protein